MAKLEAVAADSASTKRKCDDCGKPCRNDWEEHCEPCKQAYEDLKTMTEAEEIREDPARTKAALAKAQGQLEDTQAVMKRLKGIRGG